MTKYAIVSPEGLRIKGMQDSDMIGMHSLLKKEGCIESENFFTDEQKAVALDDIQKRIAARNHTNPKHSMDILLCIAHKKMLLADAKFNVDHVQNVKRGDIDDKVRESRDMLSFDEYTLDCNKIYLLFKSITLTPSKKNRLIQTYKAKSPKYQFMTAIEFYNLFE